MDELQKKFQETEAVLAAMEAQWEIDKAAAQERWDAMSDQQKEEHKKRTQHMADKMQSSV